MYTMGAEVEAISVNEVGYICVILVHDGQARAWRRALERFG